MKRTLFLFGATIVTVIVNTGCESQNDSVAPVKNYYGVSGEETDKAPKEAYFTLFGVGLAIIFLFVWGIKKMGKKRN